MGRNALEYEDISSIVEDLLADPFLPQEPKEKEDGRKTKRKPHEINRAARQLAVVFPTPAWKDAVLALVAEWGVRTSDLLTWCVSYAMRAIADGKVRRPNSGAMYHQRAGECMELPWEPE